MSWESTRAALRTTLESRVGGFFANVRHEPRISCTVCGGPATSTRCGVCARHEVEFGRRLADRVLPLTYVRGNTSSSIHQSAHTVLAYKRRPPAAKCVEDLGLMVLAATLVHGSCMADAVGGGWDAVTYVPSTRFPGASHPLAELTRRVWPARPDQRLLLDLGPGVQDNTRTVRDDRFVVPESSRHKVDGRRVLLIEDTWTSGSKVQSAAVALKDAGAGVVTVLCLARWCRLDWDDHRALLDRFWAPYDSDVCPVSGELCAPRAPASVS